MCVLSYLQYFVKESVKTIGLGSYSVPSLTESVTESTPAFMLMHRKGAGPGHVGGACHWHRN